LSLPILSDEEFLTSFEQHGATEVARRFDMDLRGVYRRRERLETKIGRQITGPDATRTTRFHIAHPQRFHVDVPDGVVLVASDGHYWPSQGPSTMHRALVAFAKALEPAAIVFNGDAFDGAAISRHPPIGWADQPTVQEEIEVCQERLHEIELAAPSSCKLVWTLGNHDSRFETKIATVAPEFAKVSGVSLKDHFPSWEPAWSCWINENTVIKHRFKGGMHAPQNNTLWSGKNIITGHLHSAKVQPITDYNGTRYGVDTGCIADAFGPQFVDYTEDNPVNWRSAFAVLTFKAGRLLMPQLVQKWDEGEVEYCGQTVPV
jgi:hypothetical protein